jgi:hypothetical protein
MRNTGPSRSAMPNTAADAGARGALQQRPHRLGADGQRPAGMAARVDRPGEGELGEHRQLAALDPGELERGQVPRQVAVQVALLGVHGGEQHPHLILLSSRDRLPGRRIQRSSTA